MGSLHGPTLFTQAPDQPENVNPLSGRGLSVTIVPLSNVATHVVPHWMPARSLVIVPLLGVDTVSVEDTTGRDAVSAGESVVRNSRMIVHEG
jgi:hypothetical protein